MEGEGQPWPAARPICLSQNPRHWREADGEQGVVAPHDGWVWAMVQGTTWNLQSGTRAAKTQPTTYQMGTTHENGGLKPDSEHREAKNAQGKAIPGRHHTHRLGLA